MFAFLKKTAVTEPTPLETTINRLFEELKEMDPAAKQYDATSNQLVKLMKLQKETNSSWMPSADVLATCAANIAGILLILNFERMGVVASKALGFITKLK